MRGPKLRDPLPRLNSPLLPVPMSTLHDARREIEPPPLLLRRLAPSGPGSCRRGTTGPFARPQQLRLGMRAPWEGLPQDTLSIEFKSWVERVLKGLEFGTSQGSYWVDDHVNNGGCLPLIWTLIPDPSGIAIKSASFWRQNGLF